MNFRRREIISYAILLPVILGCGGLMAPGWSQPCSPQSPSCSPPGGGSLLEHLKRDLNLTQAQVEQLKSLVDSLPPPPPPPGPPPGMEKLEAKLKEVLTSEQWAKFQEIRKQHHHGPRGTRP